MKRILCEKYKLVNIGLFILLLSAFGVMSTNYNNWFQDKDIYFIYKVFDGVYHPVMVTVKWLAGILGVLLFVPTHIFKKWLLYVAPIILLLTHYLVQDISVYSGNLLNPTRAKMAENGMYVLVIVTIIFVIGHMVYDYRKNKTSRSV